MVFAWAPGSRIEADAQRVGERIESLRQEQGGGITPELVLEDARLAESPLHPVFEWNDGVAAERFRLDQARLVLRSITVTVAEDRRAPVRAFVAVERDQEEGRVYVGVRDALSDEALRAQLLASALREVRSWRQRYSRLQQLASVFTVIDQLDLPSTTEV